MKKLILFSFLLIVLLYFFNFLNSTNEAGITQQSGEKPFLLGAVDNRYDFEFIYISNPNYFGMNTWHRYLGEKYDSAMGRLVPTGWCDGDSLNANINDYIDTVTNIYLKKNAEHEMITLMQRPKIDWLCYGQRSDYQCEQYGDVDPYLWFYSFQANVGESITDNSQYGEGQYVLHCSQNVSTDGGRTFMGAGTVLKRLRCNNQQTKVVPSHRRYDDSVCNWHVKPSIRIDSTYANNPTNFSKLVCRVYVKDSDSNTIKKADIRVRNFKQHLDSVYKGNYLEEFYFTPYLDTSRLNNIQGAWGNAGAWDSRGNTDPPDPWYANKADIQVYWYGNCDMWIDYIRVDNDVAHRLLKGNDPQFEQWLEWEAQDIGGYVHDGFKSPYRFYIEELEFNNVPCIAYVNKKLQYYSSQNPSGDTTDMMVCFWWLNFTNHLPYNHAITNGYWKENMKFDTAALHNTFMKPTGLREFYTEVYPFTGHDLGQDPFSKIPSMLPNTSGECVLANSRPPSEYEPWLQEQLDKDGYPNPAPPGHSGIWWDPGLFTWALKLANDYSKTYNKPFINMPQAHLWRYSGIEVRREPTNEELSLTTNLALSYGAKGIVYFWYGGFKSCSDSLFTRGFCDSINYLEQYRRTSNAYHQNKWDTLISIHKRIRKWDSYFMSFDNANTSSYIYYKDSERANLLSQTYFLRARTFKPGSGTPICSPVDSLGINPHPEQSLTYDCPEHTYLQVALFDDDLVDYDKYFMIVNRRCSPFIDSTPGDNNGGRRFVRVLFDANHSAFNGYNNWNIIDLEDEDQIVLTFDKTKIENLDLGWYMPGEGRLYKIVPLIPRGGTLVTNEVIDEDVNCSGMIYNNGYDIIINHNKTLSFSEGAGIEMTGGSFFCGSDEDDEITVTLKGLNGNRWNGITLDECDTVGIYTTKFEDVKQNKTGGGNNFALNLIDCYNFKIAKSLFECKQDSAFGGINSVYISEPGDTIIAYISENTFNMNNSPSPSVEIISSAGITTPLLLQWNQFSTTCDSSIAIIINSVVGGAIKNNTIEGYKNGINSLSSSIDIYENTIITSSFNDAIGILAVSGSTLNMGPNSAYLLGGYNCFSNTGTGTRNLEVVNSYFDVNEGENSFNISDNDPQTAYHFYGYFPEELEEGDEDATINCFQLDSTENEANHDVTWGEEGDNVTFIFDDNCGGQGGGQSGGFSSSGSNDYVVFYIGNGITDTIYLRTYGNSTLYDSLCTDTRKRDYNSVIAKCSELLNNYPDSTESLDAIAKLYTASLALDSSGSKIQPLKSFLETLILNNSGNTSLINRAFYFIQKCKVVLELYESALQGFQQIINQNPYNYEGLVASWDYAATYLLDSLNGGSGGGEKGLFFDDDDDPDDKKSINDDDPYDKQKFTKEDRKVINTNVLTAFEEKNKKQVEKIKDLERKTRSHDKAERNNAEKELRNIRVLKEVVKTKHPKNKIAYVKILNKDIQKVFGGGHQSDNLREDNLIPTEFNLYQNYPNPFNPTTKIKYDLPKQGKVKLIIYDILGREIKRLINNELMPAGRHTVEFTGHHLASGVYFYRLEVDDGKEYIMTKKMVYIK